MERDCVRDTFEISCCGEIPTTAIDENCKSDGSVCPSSQENEVLEKGRGRKLGDARDKARPPLKPKPELKKNRDVTDTSCFYTGITSICPDGTTNSQTSGASENTGTKEKLMPPKLFSASSPTASAFVRNWSEESWSDGSLSDCSWSETSSSDTDSNSSYGSDNLDDDLLDDLDDDLRASRKREDGHVPDNQSPEYKAANEVLETEIAYVERLSLLYKVLYSRLEEENKQHNFLPNETLKEMFPSIHTIYELHHDIVLPELQDCMQNWGSEKKLGGLMKNRVPSLRLYTGYIQNFEKALNLINHWQEHSPKFAAIIQEIQKMPECGKIAIRDHMLEPMQRLLRYPLLLQNYLKHLPDDSPDRKDTQEALELAKVAARYSDEITDKMKKSNRLLEIYQKLRGEGIDLIRPTRGLVKEGPIIEISPARGEKQPRYLFLFNDLLLKCTKSVVGTYTVLAKMDVDGMEVKHGENTSFPETFVVYSKQQVIELLDENATEENQCWFKVLEQVIQDFQNRKHSQQKQSENLESRDATKERGARAPRWVRDDESLSCMVCEQMFTAYHRRHHCRACGVLICRGCSKKASLAYKDHKMARVCNKCHDVIVAEKSETKRISSLDKIHNRISTDMMKQTSVSANPSCKLHSIAKELLRTERLYVERLTLLYQAFYLRLQEENRQKGFLPSEIPTYMFSNIESIHQFHQRLLHDLEYRMLNWQSEKKIGDLMKAYAPYLKLYTVYVTYFNEVVNVMNHWQATSPAFAAFLDDIHQMPECGNLSLHHHMREPIKRVSQYERLLIDYLSHLPEDALDRKDAQAALGHITDASRHFQKAIQKNKEFHTLLNIHQKLFGIGMDFISPARDFVKEGPITKISTQTGERQSRYLFLFSDRLLICTGPFAGAYTVRTELDVHEMEVTDNSPGTFVVKTQHKFLTLVDEHSPEDCTGWSEVLKQVIQDHRIPQRPLPNAPKDQTPTLAPRELGKKEPLLIPKDAIPDCMSCLNPFRPYRRRHQCKACGKVICRSCGTKMSLEYTGLRKVRVCIQCQDTIESANQDILQDGINVEDPRESTPPRCKLQAIANELLQTERIYVQRLRLLQEVVDFRFDEESREGELPPFEALNEMFNSIQVMHRFHENILLRDLESCMKIWDSVKRIGDVMRRNTPYLKLYKTYVKNVDAAISLIDHWVEYSPQVADIIERIHNMSECGHLSIHHYLLEPLQRVPHYERLLKEYLHNLPEYSPDRQDAQEALTHLTKASSYFNKSMKKNETFIRLLDLYQKLRGVGRDFIRPSRYLVREGPITKIAARSGEKQSRYIFLFNDLLLICTGPFVGAYLVRTQLDLQGLEVKDGSNICIPNSFLVSSKQRVIEFLDDKPTDDGDGLCWYEVLRRAIHDCRKGIESDDEPSVALERLGTQAPRLVPSTASAVCFVCQQFFSLDCRRHHCRACGNLICRDCSKKAPLAYLDHKMARVCTECHDVIIHERRVQVKTVATARMPERDVIKFKADDSYLLSSHLGISEDNGKTWRRGWFTLHENFVMYFFHAHKDMTAYKAQPVSEFRAEIVEDSERPRVFRLHNRSQNFLFQADNYKTARLWVRLLEKHVVRQVPDDSQRLSSESNSSSISNRSSNSIDPLSQTDSGYPADSSYENLLDEVNESLYANQDTLVNDSMYANQDTLVNENMYANQTNLVNDSVTPRHLVN